MSAVEYIKSDLYRHKGKVSALFPLRVVDYFHPTR